MKLFAWSLFGASTDALKDHAATHIQVGADGSMEYVSGEHLVLDDERSEDGWFGYEEESSWHNYRERRSWWEYKGAARPSDAEIVQFKSMERGECLTAPGGRGTRLTFSNCSDTSTHLQWQMRDDKSYESVAYPGSCARQGDGIKCGRDEVVLGECPGFITHYYNDRLRLGFDEDGPCIQWWEGDVQTTRGRILCQKFRTHFGMKAVEEQPSAVAAKVAEKAAADKAAEEKAAADKVAADKAAADKLAAQPPLMFFNASHDGCRKADSRCGILDSYRCGVKKFRWTALQENTAGVLTPKYDASSSMDNQEVIQGNLGGTSPLSITAALDYCKVICADITYCKSFYLLKDATSGEEFCWFYTPEEDTCAYIEPKKEAATLADVSKWSLCIWQSEAQLSLPACTTTEQSATTGPGGSGGDAPASATSIDGCPKVLTHPEQQTEMSEVLAFRCCKKPKNNIQNNAKVPMTYGCHNGTYSEAIGMCDEQGLALCTTDQIKEGTQCESGCGYDMVRVWTRTL